jgi:hypothetical protein
MIFPIANPINVKAMAAMPHLVDQLIEISTAKLPHRAAPGTGRPRCVVLVLVVTKRARELAGRVVHAEPSWTAKLVNNSFTCYHNKWG